MYSNKISQAVVDCLIIVGSYFIAWEIFSYLHTRIPAGCVAIAVPADSFGYSCTLARGSSTGIIRQQASMLQFLFWPVALLSVLFGCLGIYRKSKLLLYAAALSSLPISLYLAATPRFTGIGLAFPLAFVLSAYLMQREKIMTAILVLLPFILVLVMLALAVVTQS
jgi:hypothetical protein